MIVNISSSWMEPAEQISVESRLKAMEYGANRIIFEAFRPDSFMYTLCQIMAQNVSESGAHQFILHHTLAGENRLAPITEGVNGTPVAHLVEHRRFDVPEWSISKSFSSRSIDLQGNMRLGENVSEAAEELRRDFAQSLDAFIWNSAVSLAKVNITSTTGDTVGSIPDVKALDSAVLLQCHRGLKSKGARYHQTPISATDRVSTAGLSSAYVMIVHENCREQIEAQPDFLSSARYAQNLQAGTYEIGYLTSSRLRVLTSINSGLLGEEGVGGRVYTALILSKDVAVIRSIYSDIDYVQEGYLEPQSQFRGGLKGRTSIVRPEISPANYDGAIGLIMCVRAYIGFGVYTGNGVCALKFANLT